MTRKPNAAEYVGLEETQPIFIADLLERFRLEDAEVVDQHVDLLKLAKQRLTAFTATQVGGDPGDGRAGKVSSELVYRSIDSRLSPAIQCDASALGRQRARGCEPDAGR
ncbi:hypothetical protein D3C86_1902580 [compost metagenome]